MKPKRLISLLIAVCMVVAMLPTAAFADNSYITGIDLDADGYLKSDVATSGTGWHLYSNSTTNERVFIVEGTGILNAQSTLGKTLNENILNVGTIESGDYSASDDTYYGVRNYGFIKGGTFTEIDNLQVGAGWGGNVQNAIVRDYYVKPVVTGQTYYGAYINDSIVYGSVEIDYGHNSATASEGSISINNSVLSEIPEGFTEHNTPNTYKTLTADGCIITPVVTSSTMTVPAEVVFNNKVYVVGDEPVTKTFTVTSTSPNFGGWDYDESAADFKVSDDGKTLTVTLTDSDVEIKTINRLIVKNGGISATLNDKKLTEDDIALKKDGNTTSASIPEGALVTVTLDENNQLWKDSGLNFDHWDIQSKAKLLDENGEEIVNPGKTFTFVMPKEGVTIEAMTKDATIEDDSSSILGTVAIGATVVAGTAVLAYQSYMLGTEFWLNYHLPYGVDIPANRVELAQLVWDDAGRPEPAAVLNADASNADKALVWAVENQLMAAADKNGEALAPDASVSRVDVIRTWKKAQTLKNG